MQNPETNRQVVPHCTCCPCESDSECHSAGFTRRGFLAATGAATAVGLALPGVAGAPAAGSQPRQHRKPASLPLKVLPVFNCEVYPRKPATSWRVTGAIQDEQELQEEEARIRRDLGAITASAGFPLEMLP